MVFEAERPCESDELADLLSDFYSKLHEIVSFENLGQ